MTCHFKQCKTMQHNYILYQFPGIELTQPQTSPGNTQTQPFWIWLLLVESPQARFFNHQKQKALCSSLNTSSRLHLESTYTLHLQYHSNWWRIWNPVEHLRWSSFTEIINVLRLLAIFAAEPHCGLLTGFSIQLYQIT